MNIPTITMPVLYKDGIYKEELTLEEALFHKERGFVSFDKWDREGWEFEFDIYLEKMLQTPFAQAWIKFHKGLNGTYEEAKDGSVFARQEDVEWFETQILGL